MSLVQTGSRLYLALGNFFGTKEVKAGLAVDGSAIAIVDKGTAYLKHVGC